MFMSQHPLKRRLLAAGVHLGISIAIAALAAWLVFAVWYPYPYREISGGRELFLIVVTVDVILGPLLTLAVFDIKKSLETLRLDLAVIGLFQLVALAYGLWTVVVVRPVHLAFEMDRFRVIHALEIPADELTQAPPEFQRLPLTGPTLLSLRNFKDDKERFEATMTALQGVPLGARPGLWQTYAQAKPQVLAHARPLEELKTRFPARVAEIDGALASASRGSDTMKATGYLPMIGRKTFWTALIDTRTAEVIAFVPIDSF
ncbi:hypothetical protein SAMN05216350_11371 [Polaromonas sp. YR568]|uniref:TfpX/TfpZ family type IV pilin accessory protein n=1 Tax=Polaromonas sp. YR568 TaxID=1855301 RepID=UPI0008EAF720|nr:TfpX/TfpZ family type IV pilin accessory protein [Polaromonas sp. YR568]SFV01808.1 hypothetical protein SAMN05216350_11371 [Polaromonas sp. YR568]